MKTAGPVLELCPTLATTRQEPAASRSVRRQGPREGAAPKDWRPD